MPSAQGSCPSCGAPILFGLGSSLARVCEHCKATVLRTDRGLANLGRVAELADTPSLIAVGDQGTLAGRPFEVLGRVQYDYGAGPWDEYYVAFDYGQNWGWLAYAQGRWHVTQAYAGLAVPPHSALRLEMEVALSNLGNFVIAEFRSARVRSAEGELPGAHPPDAVLLYADGYGPEGRFVTLDYEDGQRPPTVYAGYVFTENQLAVTQLGPRSINKVKTTALTCPNCGGEVPKMGGDRSERLGCPYCGAVSDIAERRVISQQERLLAMPDIPIGASGRLQDADFVCLAYLRRSSRFDGEDYTWEEFLLFAASIGYRWLIKDPETGWSFAMAVSPADIDRRGWPRSVGYLGRTYSLRNTNQARVDYVLGEVYWKCAVGETVQVADFASGKDGLSREESPGEVQWSHSTPIPWRAIAAAFGLAVDGAGSRGLAARSSADAGGGLAVKAVVLLVILLVFCALGVLDDDDTSPGVIITTGSGFRGGGVVFGGK